MDDAIYGMADEAHIKRERAKARELRASQWWRQQIGPGLCHHCGGKFPKNELTMDHLIPVARGGRSTKGNVVPACRPCNQARGHQLDVERTLEGLNSPGSGSSDSED
ncbi:MAG: HNH endonuclease [Bdellovibrionales bacterium]|jgi:5-methylcytosine-specific restriction protein A|nr:HNH endonuclease [Bdellovibrionales bacterium]